MFKKERKINIDTLDFLPELHDAIITNFYYENNKVILEMIEGRNIEAKSSFIIEIGYYHATLFIKGSILNNKLEYEKDNILIEFVNTKDILLKKLDNK